MSQKITIITGNHAIYNPRVVKEANTLSKAGYQVTVLNIWSQSGITAEDKALLHPSVTYIGIPNISGSDLTVFLHKVKRKIAELINTYTRWKNLSAINAGLSRIIHKAQKIPTDLYICHQECGLVAGTSLLKRGNLVAFDLEDWYSEDLLPEARKKLPIVKIKRLEEKALKEGVYVTTTSETMANAMAAAYHAPKPEVVYNVFPNTKNRSTNSKNRIHLCWFSQTVGPGRGLESLMLALNQLKGSNWELHLIGNSTDSFLNQLEALLNKPLWERISYHPFVHPSKLGEMLEKMDIGLALEEPYCLNKEHTISNKLFQYLQLGVGVVATATEGQKEVYKVVPSGIQLVLPGNADSLAKALDYWLLNSNALLEAKEAAFTANQLGFNWETESTKLLKLVQKALSANPA